jgi:ATP-binding cassette, subfamily B, bacterial
MARPRRVADGHARHTLGRIRRELTRRDGANIALIAVLLGAQAAAQSAPHLATRELIDAADWGAVVWAATAFAGAPLVIVLTRLWHRRVVAEVSYALLCRLQLRLYSHLEQHSLGFFTRRAAGEILSPLTESFVVLRARVRDVTVLLHQVFGFVCGGAVLFALNPWLGAVGCAMTPFYLATGLLGRRNARIDQEIRAAEARQSTLARERMSIDGVLAMRHVGGRSLGDQFRHAARQIERLSTHYDVRVGRATVTVELLTPIVMLCVFGYVKYQEFNGRSTLSTGTLVVCAGALNAFLHSFSSVIQRQFELGGTLGRFEKTFELRDTRIEIRPGPRRLTGDAPGELAFEDVWFRYDDQWILKGVTLRVPVGERVAVVGASGAGKTTLGLLAVRHYDVAGGRVSIGGVDVRELSFDSGLDRVGYVPQSSFLFDDTIRANICIARSDATDDEIFEVARKAQIHDWIVGLPDGYDTVVGPEGVRLSGGQAQRVVIARTLLNDPPLLVLDEATSALDGATQLAVDRALHELERNRTTLLIAHRLSTVRDADRIVVLDDGEVAEEGAHEELLVRNGKYAELVRAGGH